MKKGGEKRREVDEWIGGKGQRMERKEKWMARIETGWRKGEKRMSGSVERERKRT